MAFEVVFCLNRSICLFYNQAARSRDAAMAMVLEMAVHKDIKVDDEIL